ncbi:unnamed protein product [Ceutorhynchus assimilis]|uniref:Uncharacterized protein n=1 Tax=Ceutorhynchus assimilis TaxID=467358 RepID=A0A9N9QQ94_9CUCU|nr:unnamed protein product [Ceutorhynchus assimilis]
MSVKKFFTGPGQNWLKVFKNWTNHLQKKYHKRKCHHQSIISVSTFGRASVSTEITVLEYEMTPSQNNNEINENKFNESIEQRWICN